MNRPELVFCYGANERFMRIATEAGFRYGARLPGTVYGRIWFADQDWKKPDHAAYMAELSAHKPYMATVLDLEREDQLDEVLSWAEDAVRADVCRVVIIPKVPGLIARLPRHVLCRPVVLGYSIPTKHGGTTVPIWEFFGRPMHLLGGSPHGQMRLWRHLQGHTEVYSCDGNMAAKMATQRCAYWSPVSVGRKGRWVVLEGWPRDDAPAECLRRSCAAIKAAWERVTSEGSRP